MTMDDGDVKQDPIFKQIQLQNNIMNQGNYIKLCHKENLKILNFHLITKRTLKFKFHLNILKALQFKKLC